MIKTFDIVLRFIPKYGWLPIILDHDKKELYRGEFRQDTDVALHYAEEAIVRLNLKGWEN